MDIERRPDHIRVLLSRRDRLRSLNGVIYGKRANEITTGATVTVYPLSFIENHRSERRGRLQVQDVTHVLTTPFRAYSGTEDKYMLFLPENALDGTIVNGGAIPRDQIQTSSGYELREERLEDIPEKGFVVEFEKVDSMVDVVSLIVDKG